MIRLTSFQKEFVNLLINSGLAPEIIEMESANDKSDFFDSLFPAMNMPKTLRSRQILKDIWNNEAIQGHIRREIGLNRTQRYTTNSTELSDHVTKCVEIVGNDDEEGPSTLYFIPKRPLKTILLSINQASLTGSAEQYGLEPIIHLASTDKIMPNSLYINGCQIYAYSAVMRYREESFNSFDFLTSDRSTANLTKILKYVDHFGKASTQRDEFFRTVVISYSMSMLEVMLEVTMKTGITKYLEDIYCSEVNGMSTAKPDVTVLYCCSEYFEVLAAEVGRTVRKENLRPFYMSALLQIASANTFKLADARVESLLKILLTPRRTESLKDDFDTLGNPVQNEKEEQDDDRYNDIEKNYPDEDELKKISESSPFYIRYRGMARTISDHKINKYKPVNKYFNQRLAYLLLSEHLPYLPVWTCFMSPTGTRLSNSIARMSFKTFKYQWMKSDTHKTPEKVAEALKARSNAMVEMVMAQKCSDSKMEWDNTFWGSEEKVRRGFSFSKPKSFCLSVNMY